MKRASIWAEKRIRGPRCRFVGVVMVSPRTLLIQTVQLVAGVWVRNGKRAPVRSITVAEFSARFVKCGRTPILTTSSVLEYAHTETTGDDDMKDTHTHRGHCQYCLRVIAIDVTTGQLAKHGYTVRGGMFQGQCPGSEVLSLHVDRSHTNSVIKMYEAKALRHTENADALEAGKIHPNMVHVGTCYYGERCTDDELVKGWRFVYETVKAKHKHPRTGEMIERDEQRTVSVPWSQGNELQQRRERMMHVREQRFEAESAASFAKTMTKWAADIHDASVPAYLVDDLENWAKVGDMVHAGGKKNGFDAKVEAAEMQDYTTHGYRQGRSTIKAPHVQITRPAIADTFHKNGSVKKKGRAAHTYWEAVRNVQPAEGSLMARLKADELI